MKGISTTLLIIVTAVVLLIAAVLLLTFMGVNIGNIGNVMSEWLGLARNAPTTVCENTPQANCNLFSGCQWCKGTYPVTKKAYVEECARIGNCKTT